MDDSGQHQGQNTIDRVLHMIKLMNEVNKGKNKEEQVSFSALKLDAQVLLGAYSLDVAGYGKIPKHMENEYYGDILRKVIDENRNYNGKEELVKGKKWGELRPDEIQEIQKNAQEQVKAFYELSKVKRKLKGVNIIVEYVFNENILEYLRNNKLFEFVTMVQGDFVLPKTNMMVLNNDFKDERNKTVKNSLLFDNFLRKINSQSKNDNTENIFIFNSLEKMINDKNTTIVDII